MPPDEAADLEQVLHWLDNFERAFLAHDRKIQEVVESPALPTERRLRYAVEWETYRRELREQKERIAALTAES